MGKASLYQKLKKDWHHWDGDVYALASSMSSAFQSVIDSDEADAELVAELKHMQKQMVQYESWRTAQTRKASA